MTVFNLFDHKVNIELEHITKENDLRAIIDEMDVLLAPPPPVLTRHGYFETPSHGKLHYCKYLPQQAAGTNTDTNTKPKGIVVFQHGIQAHCGMTVKLLNDDDDGSGNGNGNKDNDNDNDNDNNGKNYTYYTNTGLLSRKLTDAGYALYVVDMLGHGLSEGERFYIPNGDWTINRDHLEAFAQMACEDIHVSRSDSNSNEKKKKIPLFLMGESYGGNLTIHVAKMWQNHPERIPPNAIFKGMILNAPAIGGDRKAPPPKTAVWVFQGLAHFFPRYIPSWIPNSVTAERIWKRDDVREAYTSEKEQRVGLQGSGKKFCLGTASGLLGAILNVKEEVIPGLTVPFCVHHGTMDEIAKTAGTDYLVEKCAVTEEKDRSVTMIDGALHDLLSDDTKDDTMKSILEWMDSRL